MLTRWTPGGRPQHTRPSAGGRTLVAVRIAIVAETFLPTVNGVTGSVLRVLEHLERRGHEAIVITAGPGPDHHGTVPVVRTPSVPLPCYRGIPVALPTDRVAAALSAFRPDVVHLAAPVALGAAGAAAAAAAGIPAVAVYQTDLAGFAGRYHAGLLRPLIWHWLRRIHDRCALTLAPSTMSVWQLRRHGIGPVACWARGVDLELFAPRHRDEALRADLAPEGEVIVGYVGRLAPEKCVGLLAHLDGLRGVQVVVVGEGPSRASLERALPRARFLGFREGAELSAAMASLDVFVHGGAHETFCQAVQEALASGVPVVAPAAGGPVDLVRHGENGWLFPPDDAALLRPMVSTLVAEPRLRAAMAARARASVAHRSWAVLGDELLDHYAAVTGRRAGDVRPVRPLRVVGDAA